MGTPYIKSSPPVNGDDKGYLQGELLAIEQALKGVSGGSSSSGGGASIVPGMRLSSTAHVAVSTADVGTATIYGVPVGSGSISLYDGTSAWVSYSFTSDRTLNLDAAGHVATAEYSIFAYYDGDVKLGTGPAWTTSTNPGTGAGTAETEIFEGRSVNKYAISLRNNSTNITVAARRALLVGGFATPGTAATCEDSSKKRLLSNVYNVAPRPMRRIEDTDSWTGTASNAFRQANTTSPATSPNLNAQLEFFSVNGAYPITCYVNALVTNSTSTPRTAATGIGLDSYTAAYLGSFKDNLAVDNTRGWPQKAYFNEYVPAGRHMLVWLELSGTNDTRTWYGDAGNDTGFQCGMSGTVYN